MRGAIDTITIWCRHRDKAAKKDTWHRHIIPGCIWEQEEVVTATGTGAVMASKFSVLITENPDYRPFREWKDLPVEDKVRFFTLNTGDLVAKGYVEIDITNASPFTASEVKDSLLPDAFTIGFVEDNTEPYKRGRHYEVAGV